MPDYYRHTLTLAILQTSGHPKFYKTLPSQKNGLLAAQKDSERTMLINHVHKRLGIGTEHGQAEQEKYKKHIEKELSITAVAQINTAYSQALPNLISDLFTYNPSIGTTQKLSWQPVNRVQDLYQADKEVYLKITSTGYTVTQLNPARTCLIPSPVEVLYKLQNGQFILQHVKTNSDFIRDVFLGKEISAERLSQEIQPLLKKIAPIEKLLLQPNKKDPDIQQILTTARQSVQMYKEGGLNAQDLVTLLTNLQKAAGHFEKSSSSLSRFFQRPTTASILQKAIDQVKLLPDYMPPVKTTSPAINEPRKPKQ